MVKEPGIYKNVPYPEYKTWECLSTHGVSNMLRSALHYHVMVVNDRPPTDSMILGQLVDAMLLENGRLDDFFIQPETYLSVDKKGVEEVKAWTLRSNTCKMVYQQALGEGKTPVTTEQIAKAQIMVDEVKKHPMATELLSDCETQVSYVWDQDVIGANGLPTGKKCRMKGRMDAVKEGHVIDLKTTWNASPASFGYEIHKYKYYIQLAVYSECYTQFNQGIIPGAYIIAVENELPHCVVAYQLGVDSLATGKALWNEAMLRYVECQESGIWPGYSNTIEEIDIPRYAIDRALNEGVFNV